ncbi:uncharacterized protein K452DRAFT_116902 [Aplosporella prunicola CBS 121167]|uniref:Uncharacterized protein n=1 Tax=Aplosporella prunicola CBS 121167 TaxID=1176127 RepID=A0A6A6B2E2_9PEZI|nr:uncharacterized protein K452DRAFT_116902 [Aplosporella prunicola CBS 121167]KAF2136901.1 hypothetical protein K452DRAFT_116902 [Aplosporella prunicola CBS 121167]
MRYLRQLLVGLNILVFFFSACSSASYSNSEYFSFPPKSNNIPTVHVGDTLSVEWSAVNIQQAYLQHLCNGSIVQTIPSLSGSGHQTFKVNASWTSPCLWRYYRQETKINYVESGYVKVGAADASASSATTWQPSGLPSACALQSPTSAATDDDDDTATSASASSTDAPQAPAGSGTACAASAKLTASISDGAGVGIGFAAGTAVAAALTAGFWSYWQRRQRRQRMDGVLAGAKVYEAEGGSIGEAARELPDDAQRPAELQGWGRRVAEMGGEGRRAELGCEGGYSYWGGAVELPAEGKGGVVSGRNL